ncbi:hypothetical membrane protein, conserved [Pyrococcus sp. NA2]|uniref:hypothetical protein n=1 Tax=Pyrococcus sp. (strain NA2) TaxID=342949 RepID=UPI000209A986|nr:hypothetical protein [Pyrococcus sp. NA2]AEC51892.1 hypothetical membrane protein, conserved [Pyrococcus sp. NA2]
MRVFIKDYLLPWLLVIFFWVAIWVFVPWRGIHLSLPNVLLVFALLSIFLLVALHFVGKALERYGYSQGDVRMLPEIIERAHGQLYLAREIFDIIARALIFWGLFSTAVLLTENPLLGIVNAVAMFALIFSFFVLLISMVIWVLFIPCLYRLLRGRELNRSFLVELVKLNFIFTAILLTVSTTS